MSNYTRQDMKIEDFDELYKAFADNLKLSMKSYNVVLSVKGLIEAIDKIINKDFYNVLDEESCVYMGAIYCIKDKKIYVLLQINNNIEVLHTDQYVTIGDEISEDIIFRLFTKEGGDNVMGCGYADCELKDFFTGVLKYLKEDL